MLSGAPRKMLEINESFHVKSTQFFSYSGVVYFLRRFKVVRGGWRGWGRGWVRERNEEKDFRFSLRLSSSPYVFYILNSFFTATEPHSVLVSNVISRIEKKCHEPEKLWEISYYFSKLNLARHGPWVTSSSFPRYFTVI